MTILLAVIAGVSVGAAADHSSLEKAFRESGTTGFLQAVLELEQVQGPARTAKTLAGLLTDHDRELEATAAHAIGRMGKAGKTVLTELARALRSRDFPAELLNKLGSGDIPLWLAEALPRPDDPSFGDAASALVIQFDLKNERRLLPLLIQVVRNPDPDAGFWPQYCAVRVLGNMETTAAPSRQVLVDVVKTEPDDDADSINKSVWTDVRGVAACALGKIGAEPESTAELLTGMLNHPDPQIRDWSTMGLALLDRRENPARAAKTLVGLLRGHDRELGPEVLQAIGGMGEAGKAVLPGLAKGMGNTSFAVEYLNEYDLGDVPLWLAEALLRPDDPSFEDVEDVLGWVVLGLKYAERKSVLPLLIQGAGHPNLEVRYRAVDALGWLGETAASARPLLVDILKEERPGDVAPSDVWRWNSIRGNAAFSLGQIGAEPESTVRLLTEMLKHPEREVWSWSAKGLGMMEEQAAPAVPPLVEALAREYDDESSFPGPFPEHPAAWALCHIGEPAIPALIDALQSEQPVVRRRAADALCWSANKKTALGALIKAATEDDDREVRIVATRALRWWPSPVADDALLFAAAIRILKDKSPEVRVKAVHVLWSLQSREEAPSQPLMDCLNDSDAKVRLTAVEAISRASPRKEIEPAVERLLNDPDEAVRSSARKLLKRLREKDKK